MITVIPSDARHHADHGWLDTRWHFSFSDYHDPDNMNWGPLRVFNDDVIRGGGGFGLHPHRDMEIVTYVIHGKLEHRDHLGGHGVLGAGEVQVMSAGKGIMHSEFNASKTDDVHLLQLWLMPRHKDNTPRYEQKPFAPETRRGQLVPVVSSVEKDGTLAIDQDATIYVSHLPAGQSVTHSAAPDRKVYLFVIDGDVSVNGTKLAKGDQARIADEPELKVTSTGKTDAHFMLIDLPE